MTNLTWFVRLFLFVLFVTPRFTVFAQTPQLIISEVFVDPKAVSDSDGEWFEIYNPTDQTISLQNAILKDDGSDTHTIQSDISIKPHEYFVFCRNGKSEENGGVNCGYEYSKFSLANESDEIVLEKDGEIARLNYSKQSYPVKSGYSMELENGSWHLSTNQFGKGDYGTPGTGNSAPPSPSFPPTSTPTNTPKPTKTPTITKEPTKEIKPLPTLTPVVQTKPVVLGEKETIPDKEKPNQYLISEKRGFTDIIEKPQEVSTPSPSIKNENTMGKYFMWGGIVSMMASIGSFLIISNKSA